MLCGVCKRMLQWHDGQGWRGTFDLQFDHHNELFSLQESANTGCCICRSLFAELQKPGISSILTPGMLEILQLLRLAQAQGFVTRAGLSMVRGFDELYRLEFQSKDPNWARVFVLKKLDNLSVGAEENSFDGILSMVRKWIHRCERTHTKCVIDSEPPWYPTRLIDLESMCDQSSSERFVRLISTKDWPAYKAMIECRYVTLSHCWGKAQFLCLSEENLPGFQEGISLKRLPQTFQDAMLFATRLRIRYIWIDSLCIKQGHAQDWLSESAEMHKIYSHSFCNFSATAAKDSSEGLFLKRQVEPLWQREVELNTEFIPGQVDSRKWIKPCAIMDPMFWEQKVDTAPVNTRGWVLQERLMAPRVLHFCQDHIAWECNEEDAAECYPEGFPSLQLTESGKGDIVFRSRLKGLDPNVDGKSLREARLKRAPEPLPHLVPVIYSYELWKRIVEVYSKARLTKPIDKLIALSGIAKLLSGQIGGKYVAGMWEKLLASQLLWRVEPLFANGLFSYLSKRPPEYRAPTFSWASVDSETGITYGETTDEGLLISVKSVDVLHVKDEFGLVKDGHLLLTGSLKRIEIQKLLINQSTRYGWKLRYASSTMPSVKERYMYTNMYLDSPFDDSTIFGPDNDEVYCVPAAFEGHEESGKYLICLLLQVVKEKYAPLGTFRRIGLTKIAPRRNDQEAVLKLSGEEASIPHCQWDKKAKVHTVRII